MTGLKKAIVVALGAALVAIGCYGAYRAARKCMRAAADYETAVYVAQMMLSSDSRSFSPDGPLRVVCLGNSITRHACRPEVGWYADWGMAASDSTKDYCHVLEHRLNEYAAGSVFDAITRAYDVAPVNK